MRTGYVCMAFNVPLCIDYYVRVSPQPPYSPDLSPCDGFLFPKLKNLLKGHHFGTLENIQTAVTDQLKAIPISEFHQCYEEWKKRLQCCVASEGSYFEGDNVKLYRLAVAFRVTIRHPFNKEFYFIQKRNLITKKKCLCGFVNSTRIVWKATQRFFKFI
ncbi:putative transposase [Trichonephila clavipes]|nr:putative transposase [Trichonephila clavipes]